MPTTEQQDAITGEIQIAVRHSAVYGFGSILTKALGFLMLPVYTHYLRPTDYGILEILDLSVALLGMILNLGMTAAFFRYCGLAETPEAKNQAVSTGYVFVIFAALVTFLLGVGVTRPISSLLFGAAVPSKYLLLSFATLVMGFVTNPARAYLRILGASTAFVMVETMGLFSMLLLNILFIVVFHFGLVGILLSSASVTFVQMVMLAVWTFRRVGFHLDRHLLRQMIGFGSPLILSNLAIFILNFSDRYFLQHLMGLNAVGVYALGYKVGFMLNYLLVQPFCAMWEPRMYAIQRQPGHRNLFGHIFVLYSLVLTYAALAISLLGPELLKAMVDRKFASSIRVIPLVALSYVFWGAGYFAQGGMLLKKSTHLIAGISILTILLNLGLNYFLILRFGILGAAWATLISFAAVALTNYWCSQRLYPLPLGGLRVVGIVVTAGAMYVISQQWSRLSIPLTMLGNFSMLVLFPFVIWHTGLLSDPERDVLRSTRNSAANRMRGLFLKAWSVTSLEVEGNRNNTC